MRYLKMQTSGKDTDNIHKGHIGTVERRWMLMQCTCNIRFVVGRVPSLFISKDVDGVLQNQQHNPTGLFISWNWKGI